MASLKRRFSKQEDAIDRMIKLFKDNSYLSSYFVDAQMVGEEMKNHYFDKLALNKEKQEINSLVRKRVEEKLKVIEENRLKEKLDQMNLEEKEQEKRESAIVRRERLKIIEGIINDENYTHSVEGSGMIDPNTFIEDQKYKEDREKLYELLSKSENLLIEDDMYEKGAFMTSLDKYDDKALGELARKKQFLKDYQKKMDKLLEKLQGSKISN